MITSSKKKIIALSLLGAAALIAAASKHVSSAAVEPVAHTALQNPPWLAQLDTISSRLDQLERRMASNEAPPSRGSASPADERHSIEFKAPEQPAPDPEPTTAEDSAQAAEAAVLAQVERLEEGSSLEPVDEAWAESSQAFIQDALRDAPENVQLQTADCRSSLCRIELGFDRRENRDTDLRDTLETLAWPGEGFVYVEDDEALYALVFLAREGARLPRAEAW